MTEILLYPRPPYDFHASALIFAGGDPAIRIYEGGLFSMALETRFMPVLITIRSSGTVMDPLLHLEIRGEGPVPPEVIPGVREKTEYIFNLQEDLTPMYQELGEDPGLTDLIRDLYSLKSPTTPTVFEALVDSIIEQQISLAVAYQLESRLIRQTGTRLIVDGTSFFCYPTPAILAETPHEVFRNCGLTLRKSEYIRDISTLVETGRVDLEGMQQIQDTDTIIDKLCILRGIGRWSAELTLLRGLHRYDAFPAADIALRRMIANRFCNGRKISAEEAREIAKSWGIWKGLISFYLEVWDRMERIKINSGNLNG